MQKKALNTILIGSVFLGIASCSAATVPTPSSTPEAKLKIGGSSETYPILEELTERYSKSGANTQFEFLPPSQTGGGINGVKLNELNIGSLSRKLTKEEMSQGLEYVPLADVPLVMAVHDSVTGVSDITAEQLKAIYSGEIKNWQEIGGPDATITLFDLSEDENEKVVLREAYLGKNLEITPTAVVFAEDDELLESAAITEYSIAAVPLEDEISELPVNILSIDGIAPSPESIQSGEYAMTLSLGMAISQQAESEVTDFVAFVNSEEGQQLLADAVEESEEEDDDDDE
ncbi:MAG: substrate-binding domain-containing protein [Cyanobacteria bacterium P01_D01_bin.105]